ncbi:PREDICTED: LOW QUALITY PROTEIN: SH3 domain-binding protein 1-like [Galeopterus variegatus]|uniref:LOW QUALITY PROTEIN: SH3 domain-binding protein 1-like n=1 Tax=Galeopterus variegatus TaxID=482537 RepID=A0ABM0SJ53_GALVR|nr:PREDICTED: LOW QUALITY PROTEIN: SH3 domain-binding protein 1-like [Galeopterus variegatus]
MLRDWRPRPGPATTQARAPAAAPATATEATAVAVVGPAATRAAPPGPPVPATTAGAALRVGASEPRQTQLGAPWHRERPGPRTPGVGEGGQYPPSLQQRGLRANTGQLGPGKTLRVGSVWTRRAGLCCFQGCPSSPPAHQPCPGNKEPLRTQRSPFLPSCSMPAHQAGDHYQ